jgi:hypothetical protein
LNRVRLTKSEFAQRENESKTRLAATSDASGVVEFDVDAQANYAELDAVDPVDHVDGRSAAARLDPRADRRGGAAACCGRRARRRRIASRCAPDPEVGCRIESRFAQVLDASKQQEWRTESNARGEFATRAPPSTERTSDDATITCPTSGSPDHPESRIEIVLSRLGSTSARLKVSSSVAMPRRWRERA